MNFYHLENEDIREIINLIKQVPMDTADQTEKVMSYIKKLQDLLDA